MIPLQQSTNILQYATTIKLDSFAATFAWDLLLNVATECFYQFHCLLQSTCICTSIGTFCYVAETPTDFSVFCSHSQLASEIICLNRRDRTSQGGLVGSRDVGISRMQLLDAYRGVEASLYFHPHLVNGAYKT